MRLTPHSSRHSTYNTLLFTFIGIISLGLVCTLFFSQSFKQKTVQELAEEQARQQAEIIFRTIWHGMLRGWTREQMDGFIHSLEMNTDNSKVQLVRTAVVDELFGDHLPSQQQLMADPELNRVMRDKETRIYNKSGYIRYLYPILAEENCISCHINSAPGKVHGILDIRFPDHQMQQSLNYTLNFYIFAIVLLMLVLFLALFIIIRNRVVHPMRDLSSRIRRSIKDDLSVERIDPERYHLKEPYTLANSFNHLASELEEYHRQLRESSWLDSLTGLYNRRYFSEQMPNLLKKARQNEQPCALMLIDLDKFKPINDELGHDAGDLALVHFSRVLQQQVKGCDLVIRLGGDEFVIILTNTSMSGVLAVKKNIEQALASEAADLGKGRRFLSASIGYALYPEDATTAESLLQQADEAMYNQKRLKKMQRAV
ncbi:diguanylate cyclase [Oceanospirillum sediminis]|uniref:Diguanylate cyclase n=1 Tax=Oceanospirillum sediminis TaxID=2760088 RepID=A0A839INP9_9GAMM|nr:diguanylate cyclase [Oceanospirillum sediminis]MBB1486097.1 diguanylate cyclase [Oceanospirillum sediminis]